jgi:hypothetical protein
MNLHIVGNLLIGVGLFGIGFGMGMVYGVKRLTHEMRKECDCREEVTPSVVLTANSVTNPIGRDCH